MEATETQITLTLPADIADRLSAEGDLSRVALEALALNGYREGKLTGGQLQRLLGLETSLEVHAFLRNHDAYLNYGYEDLEHDRQEGDRLQPPE